MMNFSRLGSQYPNCLDTETPLPPLVIHYPNKFYPNLFGYQDPAQPLFRYRGVSVSEFLELLSEFRYRDPLFSDSLSEQIFSELI